MQNMRMKIDHPFFILGGPVGFAKFTSTTRLQKGPGQARRPAPHNHKCYNESCRPAPS
jgi:hypothetical protein